MRRSSGEVLTFELIASVSVSCTEHEVPTSVWKTYLSAGTVCSSGHDHFPSRPFELSVHQPFYSSKTYKVCLSYPLNRRFGGPHSRLGRFGGPHSRLGRFGEKKYLLPLHDIEQRFLGRPDCSIPAPVLHCATYIKSRAKMDPFGVNCQRWAGNLCKLDQMVGRAIYLSTAH